MSGNTFKVLSLADDLITTLSTFYNLIHLEVTSTLPVSIDRTLSDFLQISPNLESLVFAQGLEKRLSNDDDGWTLNLVPRCLLLHLKSVEFQEFHGHLAELNAVKLFLKNAGILQKMTIVYSSILSTDLKNEIMEQILMFPRGSTSYDIKFS